MSSSPVTSKYLSVAADIERDVRLGLWEGGRMPSVRKVADALLLSFVCGGKGKGLEAAAFVIARVVADSETATRG